VGGKGRRTWRSGGGRRRGIRGVEKMGSCGGGGGRGRGTGAEGKGKGLWGVSDGGVQAVGVRWVGGGEWRVFGSG